mgnify:CR=1 FL=1
MNEENKIDQVITEITNSLAKYKSFSNKISSTKNISSNFISNIKIPLNLIYISISIIFASIFLLFYFKPNFVMKEEKNEETFFIETRFNYKFAIIISIIISIFLSYLLIIINKNYNLFSGYKIQKNNVEPNSKFNIKIIIEFLNLISGKVPLYAIFPDLISQCIKCN